MKYVNKAEDAKSDTNIKERLFDKAGEACINKKEKAFAKVITKTRRDGRSESYHVRVHKGVPYDPWGMHSHREEYLETKFQKVSKDTFDYYMMFLKTRNMLYMTRAQRSFIND